MLQIRGALRTLIDSNTETCGDLSIIDDTVVPTSVAATARRPVEVLDATGCIVTPGLVNAHHHLLQSAFRTLPGTRGVPMRDWLPTMASAYADTGIDPELAHASALVGIAEGLLNGVTTVADHHLTWPADSDDVGIATATVQAAERLGGRLVFVCGSARDDPEAAAASAEDIVAALLGKTHGGISADGMLHRWRSAPPGCTATASSPSSFWPRWPRGTASAAALRPTSRSTS